MENVVNLFLNNKLTENELKEYITSTDTQFLLDADEFIRECLDALKPLMDDEDGDGKIDPPKMGEIATCASIVYFSYRKHFPKLKLKEQTKQKFITNALIYIVLKSSLNSENKKLLIKVIFFILPNAWLLTNALIDSLKKSCNCCGKKENKETVRVNILKDQLKTSVMTTELVKKNN